MCSPERRFERASASDVNSKDPKECFVWLESILPDPAVMMMHQKTTVPGGLIVCCKEAGMSLLHGD